MKYKHLKIRLNHFNRWTRKNWAAFASMGKVIKISVISTMIIISLEQNAEAQSINTIQEDTIHELEQVEVTGELPLEVFSEMSRMVTVIEPSQIKQSPVNSINDLLAQLSQVDVRQRGPISVQADIGIRGSNFDQVLVLLNGVNINNIQTGHHNLDIPISLDQIEKIEILSGAASRIYGPDAYSGVVNIITKKPNQKEIEIGFLAGEYGLHSGNITGNIIQKNLKSLISIGVDGSKGYIKNTDFQNFRAYYFGIIELKKSKIEIQSNIGTKDFGAQNFYTAKYPNQFESTQKAFASLSYKREAKYSINSTFYWRGHADKFELFRIEETAPTWYKNHNYHFLKTLGFNNNISKNSKIGKTSLGVNLRFNKLKSNVLGEINGDTVISLFYKEGFYTKEAERAEISFFIDHTYYLKSWRFSGGIMANQMWNVNSTIKLFPGIEISKSIYEQVRIFISYNTSMRQPTFTDLYYKGPTNIGNANLLPETSKNFEIGIKHTTKNLYLYFTSYIQEGKNTIDWVRYSDTTKWQPMNISISKGYGIETGMKYINATNPRLNILIETFELNYSWGNFSRSSGEYQSNYVDDFLKNKLSISLNQRITKRLKLNWNYIFQERNGSFNLYDQQTQNEKEVLYGQYHIVNFKVSYETKNQIYYLQGSNIFDLKYYDYSNIESPGRWISAGLKININY